MRIKYKDKSVSAENILLLLIMARAPLASFVSGVFYHLPIVSGFSSLIYPSLIVLFLLINIKRVFEVLTAQDVLGGIVLIILIIISYSLNPGNREYIVEALPELFIEVIPYYVFGLLWIQSDDLFDKVFYISSISIAVNVLYLLLFIAPRGELNYSMSTAYAILPSCMVCSWYFFKNEKKVALLFWIIGTFMLLFLGTRGPIIIHTCYVVILMWNKAKTKAKVVLCTGTAIIVYVVLNTNAILYFSIMLSNFARKRGLSTRLFDILARGELISYTSGRDEFYRTVSEKIYERPFFGYGIYGERQFVHDAAHRIWLEIWCHYGLIFGTIVIVWMVYLIISGHKAAGSQYMKDFISLWAIHLGIRGIFGSDYISYYSAFLFGLCINAIRANQKANKNMLEFKRNSTGKTAWNSDERELLELYKEICGREHR